MQFLSKPGVTPLSVSHLQGTSVRLGQDLCPIGCDEDGVLVLSCQAAVSCHHGPLVRPRLALGLALQVVGSVRELEPSEQPSRSICPNASCTWSCPESGEQCGSCYQVKTLAVLTPPIQSSTLLAPLACQAVGPFVSQLHPSSATCHTSHNMKHHISNKRNARNLPSRPQPHQLRKCTPLHLLPINNFWFLLLCSYCHSVFLTCTSMGSMVNVCHSCICSLLVLRKWQIEGAEWNALPTP